jgi:hypothetical protein
MLRKEQRWDQREEVCKLWATVRSDNCRKAKAGYPGREEGISTIGGSGGGKWDNFCYDQ